MVVAGAWLAFAAVGLVFALVIGILVFTLYRGNAHNKEMEAFAAARNWPYTRVDRNFAAVMPQVAPFGQGSSRTASNIIRFAAGGGTGTSFDYQYTTSSGSGSNRTTTTHRFHVVTLDLPHPLPRLVLRPEHALDGIGKAFGAQDVQFESEEFNRAWLVKSEYLPAAHDIVSPQMMEWLMLLRHRGVRFVLQDHVLYTYAAGRQRTEHIDHMIAILAEFAGLIPPFVWQKSQGEYPRLQRRHWF